MPLIPSKKPPVLEAPSVSKAEKKRGGKIPDSLKDCKECMAEGGLCSSHQPKYLTKLV